MLIEDYNHKSQIKDTSSLPSLYSGDRSYSKFYSRANKLVTALYMVTDIMDKEEPLRSKLRTLGANVVSDMHSASGQTYIKIDEILSFLDIASTVGMISHMNATILRKEFLALKQSVKDSEQDSLYFGEGKTLSDFIKQDDAVLDQKSIGHSNFGSIGHSTNTRIGVQKGGTLMKALSDRIPALSVKKEPAANNFLALKNERRDAIKKLIEDKSKQSPEGFIGLTITDIRTLATGVLAECGEKTLQRELVSMVHDGVLKKTGEKRWSRYFLSVS